MYMYIYIYIYIYIYTYTLWVLAQVARTRDTVSFQNFMFVFAA